MTQELSIVEGNKLIAIFDGLTVWHKGLYFVKNNLTIYPENLQYHSSWDWQIPVWSKVAQLSQKLAMTQELATRHNRMLDLYEQAIFQNKPEEGQKIIADFIQWYNSTVNKSKE